MATRNKRSARRQSVDGARPKQSHRTSSATTEEVDPKRTSTGTPQAFHFECLLCGHAKGRANVSASSGEWVISCWSCTQSSYLFELAEALEVHGGGYTLKEDPRRYLEQYITAEGARPSEPAALPSEYDIRGWRQMLLEDDDAMTYLRRARGLNSEVIAKAALGYDGQAFIIPIKDVRTRELVNVRRRFWPKLPASGAKYQGLAGRTIDTGGVTVYPGLPPGPLVLVAGEFDALVLWRHRLPGITVTSGAATRWRDEWAWMVVDRRVAVIFDADPREEDQAVSRAAELRRAGAEAWPVRLSTAGLSNGEDISNWFVDQGRSRGELLAVINRERRPRRRKRVAT
jgi:hypothetical protein